MKKILVSTSVLVSIQLSSVVHAQELEEEIIKVIKPIPSLMFSQQEIDDIEQVYAAYKTKEALGQFEEEEEVIEEKPDFVSGLLQNILGNVDVDETEINYPNFYLSSIFYSSPKDWSVWINGIKLTQKKNRNEEILRVIKIDREEVTFAWRPQSIKHILAVEDIKNYREIETDFVNSQKNTILIDEDAGVVRFRLKPNQTFSSSDLEILEGRFPGNVVISEGALISGTVAAVAFPDDESQNQAVPVVNEERPELLFGF